MKLEWSYNSSLSNIEPLTELVDEQLELLSCPMKVQYQINIVIDEIFSNICNYAYPDGEGRVTVLMESSDDAFSLTFMDCGIAFNPLAKEDPDPINESGPMKEGGFGIFLSKKLTDHMEYHYDNGVNHLTITKNL